MTWDILICTIPPRAAMLSRLIACLKPQVVPGVSIFTMSDDGQLTIGEKRQRMIEHSHADYVCFIDDDDLVSADYVERIVDAMQHGPDVVGFKLRHYVDGEYRGYAVHSREQKKWATHRTRDGLCWHARTPNHLNPVRRDWVLEIGYPKLNCGEDAHFSKHLFAKYGETMHEQFVDAEIYYYYSRTSKPEDDAWRSKLPA